MKCYVTNKNSVFQEREIEIKHHPKAEMQLVKIYPEIQGQEFLGFGGAMTEASAYVWSRMSPESQKRLLQLYFGEEGNRYNFARLHIQSCDFGLGNRAYVEETDNFMETFSIEEDCRYQIPFIQVALKINPDISFLASPWSPPAFMKSNGEMNHGGKLLEKYYDAWAEIMVRYLLAYREKGIEIQRITVQNEPAAVQKWDSCIYTAEEEAEFAVKFLKKHLNAAGLDHVKILVWDHNKDLVIERCEGSFSVSGAEDIIDGIAFHWYSGDHFEALAHIREQYPDKELIFTEGCVEYSRYTEKDPISYAEMYAHDIIGDLKAGMNGFLDWNIILDEQGGPNHVRNFCDAPVMCNPVTDEIEVKMSYYYLGHFSRFLQPGARKILMSSYHKDLECVGFKNPDGSVVAVILNESDQDRNFELLCEQKGAGLTLEAHSIMTVIL